jgi:tRNA-uridine 2-sulfurtransferase
MSERWLVAMSGGVDSSVAAALLVRSGVSVVGVTMDLGYGSMSEPASEIAGSRAAKRCCGLPDADDARLVAEKLGIRHYTANMREQFRKSVVDPFLDEYAAGRTPIPCVACNRALKLGWLRARAEALGAAGVATGHYARLAPGPDGRPALHRPRDREKDQTYFMFDLTPDQLAALRLPLGDLKKEEVRDIARELGLITADKPESQGICFIPDGDVRGALARLRPASERRPGPIVDRGGRELGQHAGAMGYTLGQRHGLGLADGPWYVVSVDVPGNRLVVDRQAAVLRTRVEVERAAWRDGAVPEEEVRVQVRHRHAAVPAHVDAVADDRVRLVLEEPVWAPAAGQAAVVYDAADERVLGGGWIAGSA